MTVMREQPIAFVKLKLDSSKSLAVRRKEAVRKQVIVTVLRRQGLTLVEAEEQYEAGLR